MTLEIDYCVHAYERESGFFFWSWHYEQDEMLFNGPLVFTVYGNEKGSVFYRKSNRNLM